MIPLIIIGVVLVSGYTNFLAFKLTKARDYEDLTHSSEDSGVGETDPNDKRLSKGLKSIYNK